ncbi:uncharacterized protein LOC111303769 [Durio zibethinus]|uniref:Uncharacterized protein LOC111303769 n=1 Tax=Durio zibethinus TaxID=66656 RepID=A0A6P5ZTR5_DURZI|nr:uncharacterized protein LOC111303769 [Durio zibethinus]
MATSALKSTTKRTSVANSPGDSSSSNRSSVHRRARSLSRFSRRLPGADHDNDEPTPAPRSRGRFVNTVRGSGFPEISLDDLTIELFGSSLRGRSASRNGGVIPRNGEGGKGVGESLTQRRGRSVSRQGSRGSFVNSGGGGRLTSDTANSSRRRSVSAVRYQISDSEVILLSSSSSLLLFLFLRANRGVIKLLEADQVLNIKFELHGLVLLYKFGRCNETSSSDWTSLSACFLNTLAKMRIMWDYFVRTSGFIFKYSITIKLFVVFFALHLKKVNEDLWKFCTISQICLFSFTYIKDESDLDLSQNSSNRASMRSSIGGNNQISSTHNPTASNNRQGLRKSLSQKDLKSHDDYSSHSAALTDDEGRDAVFDKNGMERTIRTVYAQKKGEHPIVDDVNGGLYAAMRKELRHAVEEIKTQLWMALWFMQSMVKTNSGIASDDRLQPVNFDAIQAVSTIRRKYTTKLEKSEKHSQDLAEIMLEEQHGRELSKIVKEFLPEPKNPIFQKPLRATKRSNDRNSMSRQLTEEAEKYIEDFISNVEDTDISSFDGDRSDTSSSIGGITKTPTFQSRPVFKSVPVEMDGVMLPWLQWETSNDASPLSHQSKCNLSQEAPSALDLSNQFTRSRESWSPALAGCPSVSTGEVTGTKFGESGSYQSHFSSSGTNKMQFDVADYLNDNSNEAFHLEIWSQRHRISSGGLLLCNRMFV